MDKNAEIKISHYVVFVQVWNVKPKVKKLLNEKHTIHYSPLFHETWAFFRNVNKNTLK